jgi:undecaprenyl-diphosphatase
MPKIQQNKFYHHFKKITVFSAEIIILMITFFAALITFILIAKNIFAGNSYPFDAKAFIFVDGHINNLNTEVMEFFTFLGTHLFLIPANLILIIWFLFVEKKRWFSIKISAIAISSLLVMFILKLTFVRPRPSDPLLVQAAGYSFPSGHALMSVTFYGLLLYIIFQYIKDKWIRLCLSVFFIALVLLIGLSRIYLRVHYASDVIAGFCVGITWLILSLWIISKIENYRKESRNPTQ